MRYVYSTTRKPVHLLDKSLSTLAMWQTAFEEMVSDLKLPSQSYAKFRARDPKPIAGLIIQMIDSLFHSHPEISRCVVSHRLRSPYS